MKNRIIQSILIPLMLILNIIFNIMLLVFAPVFWIGAIFWKDEKFHEMYDFWLKHIPKMPDEDDYSNVK